VAAANAALLAPVGHVIDAMRTLIKVLQPRIVLANVLLVALLSGVTGGEAETAMRL
jgi:hypothetical protein